MKIRDGVWSLDAGTGHCFLVVDKQCYLIDTGLPFAAGTVIRALGAMGVAPKDLKNILITHHDADHVGGLRAIQQWCGAKVWAHPLDIPYIEGKAERPGFKKQLGQWLAKPPLCDLRPYEGAMRVGPVQVIHTPGHTPGHVCLLYQGTLFAGDLVENKRGLLRPYPDKWNADSAQLRRSVGSLKDVDYDLVCMAHGEPYRGRIEFLAEA